MSLRAGIAIVTTLACAAPQASAQAQGPGRVTERIVDMRLADAAVAVADPVRPVIYYNPVILHRHGQALATFILAHEEAHIAHQHMRTVGGVTDPARLRRLELEADCVAARTLAFTHADAVAAAVRFFAALGRERIDELHPSGAERAARILGCAAAAGPGEAAWPRPARTDAGEGPGAR